MIGEGRGARPGEWLVGSDGRCGLYFQGGRIYTRSEKGTLRGQETEDGHWNLTRTLSKQGLAKQSGRSYLNPEP